MFLRALVVSSLFLLADSYKILALFPHRGISHASVFLALTQGLARRGHQVTVVSHFPLPTPLPNYTDVVLGDSHANSTITMEHNGWRSDKWTIVSVFNHFTQIHCRQDLASPNLRKFLQKNETFDLIVAEFFNSDCFLSVLHKFEAPVVGVSSSTAMHWISEKFGNPSNPSYVPNNLLDFSDRISFLDRVENLLVGVLHTLYYDFVIMENGERIGREFFGDLRSLRDIVFDGSLLLVNSHFSLSLARPLVPAVVEIGGIHVGATPGMPGVPGNLDKWINESAHGVIYFSLGSMIKGHTFPDEKRREFLKAFARLPQRVLWKWENETMPEKPDNVMIQKWMPQLDILCHPNVKAFISHGGLLGTTEAVHCGVPMMVMPQYGDQFTNAKALEANGGGVILHLHEATEEKVYEALKTILDPNFKKQAEDLSARFRDRPLPPLETAIYWVEYVARHRGAHHMRTAAVGMPLYKYLLLDVVAFLLLVLAVVSYLSFYVTRAIFRRIFVKKPKQKTN